MLSENTASILYIWGAGLLFAVVCAALAVRKTLAFRKAVHWPSVRGTIVQSEAYYSAVKKANTYRIRYVFVAGHEITGSTPRLSGDWFWSEEQMHAFVDRYPVGQEVEVFYDPANPKRNCLDREDRRGIRLLWIGAVFVAIVSSLLAWRLAVASP